MWELDRKILTLLSNRSFSFNDMSREKNKENDEVSSPKKKEMSLSVFVSLCGTVFNIFFIR